MSHQGGLSTEHGRQLNKWHISQGVAVTRATLVTTTLRSKHKGARKHSAGLRRKVPVLSSFSTFLNIFLL